MADTLNDSRYGYIAGMEELDFARRDCSFVFGSLGNPPEMAGFISTVAATCIEAYDELKATDLDAWRNQNLGAVVAVRQGTPHDPDAIPALLSLAGAWEDAYATFRQVDTTIVQKPPLWEEALASLGERSTTFTDRASALQSGDAKAIEEAFARRAIPPDFERLGLSETSCMALSELM